MMEVNTFVKRMLGNEWNARDSGKVKRWVEKYVDLLPEPARGLFVDVALKDKDAHMVAREPGIAWATVRGHVARAFQIMGVLARSLPRKRFDDLFRSVYEYDFGEKVTTKELTECLFGRYDRRSTQAIAVKYIPRVMRGEVDLPMPTKEGKAWIWTREQAEAWRQWFVNQKDGGVHGERKGALSAAEET